MESSRIPFLEELQLFWKGSVIPKPNFEGERVLIYPRSGFSSTTGGAARLMSFRKINLQQDAPYYNQLTQKLTHNEHYRGQSSP